MKKKGKSQSRSKSIFALALVLLFLVAALIFTFISFSYGDDGGFKKVDNGLGDYVKVSAVEYKKVDGGTGDYVKVGGIKRYKGTLGAIERGIDLNGGFYAVLESVGGLTEAEESSLNDNMKEAAKVIERRLLAAGYAGATVVEQTASNGDKSIRVEIPKSDMVKRVADAESVIDYFKSQSVLEFKIQGEEDAFLTNSDFSSFSVHKAQNGQFGVLFDLTSDGLKKLTDKTKANINKKMEIKLDGEDMLTPYDITEAQTTSPFITMGSTERESADNLAVRLNNGFSPVKFRSAEAKELSAVLGGNILTTLLVAGIIGVVLAIVIMLIFYKGLGLCAALSTLVYIVVLLFVLSQLPIVLNLAGVIAIILSIGIFAGANITIFERIKEEYSSGRSLVTSVSNGFKRAGAAVIDFSVAAFIIAIILLIFGGAAWNFAIILTIGVVLSIGLCYTITRLFVKLLLPINSNHKFYGLKRGVIEDEE